MKEDYFFHLERNYGTFTLRFRMKFDTNFGFHKGGQNFSIKPTFIPDCRFSNSPQDLWLEGIFHKGGLFLPS